MSPRLRELLNVKGSRHPSGPPFLQLWSSGPCLARDSVFPGSSSLWRLRQMHLRVLLSFSSVVFSSLALFPLRP